MTWGLHVPLLKGKPQRTADESLGRCLSRLRRIIHVLRWGEMEVLLEVGGVKTTVSVTVRVLTAELKGSR